jgi:hypothetical protein
MDCHHLHHWFIWNYQQIPVQSEWRPMSRALLVTFDVEEFDLPEDLGRRVDPAAGLAVARAGALALADLCAGGLPVTCFVTAAFAGQCPQAVQRLRAAGCEIACHGASHRDRYQRLSPARLQQRLREARASLERLAGAPVLGHRSPRLCPVPPGVLAGAGFRYDSSIHPTWVPGRYNHLLQPTRPHQRQGVLELPLTVLPLLRLPLSWIWFRSYPPPLLRAASRLLSRRPLVMVYFHSWELADLSGLDLPRLVARGCGPALAARLGDWVRWMRARGFETQRALCYVESQRLAGTRCE